MKKILFALCLLTFTALLQAQPLKVYMDAGSGKYGLKDANGKLVVKTIYDGFTNFFEGMIAVNIGGKPDPIGFGIMNGLWGFIDSTGKVVIKPAYERVLFFKEGLVAVKTNGKWGYINKAGKMVIAAKYDDAASFSDGMAKVVIDKKAGYVDKMGVLVIKPQYKFAGNFSEGLAAVSMDGEVYSDSYLDLPMTGKDTSDAPRFSIVAPIGKK